LGAHTRLREKDRGGGGGGGPLRRWWTRKWRRRLPTRARFPPPRTFPATTSSPYLSCRTPTWCTFCAAWRARWRRLWAPAAAARSLRTACWPTCFTSPPRAPPAPLRRPCSAWAARCCRWRSPPPPRQRGRRWATACARSRATARWWCCATPQRAPPRRPPRRAPCPSSTRATAWASIPRRRCSTFARSTASWAAWRATR
jgi:hypothetical protein